MFQSTPVQMRMSLGAFQSRMYLSFFLTEIYIFSLRQETDPYLGLIDCAKRIIDEEGWMTLYRAWWITLLGSLGSSVA